MTGQWPGPPQQPGQPDPWPGTPAEAPPNPQYPQGQYPQYPQEQQYPQGQYPQGQYPQYPQYPQGQYPYPAPPPPPEPKPTPADVVTAFQLWFVVAALGCVNLIAALLVIYADRTAFVDQLMEQIAAQPELEVTRAQAEQLLAFGLVGTGVVLILLLGGLTVLFAFKMRKGRNWARMLLTMGGVFTVVSAIPTVFGVGAGGGAAALVMGAAGILQAVAAVGAIVLMHRKESNAYFLNLPPSHLPPNNPPPTR